MYRDRALEDRRKKLSVSMYIPDIVVTEVEPMLLDTNDKRVGPKKPEDNSSCHLYLLGVM